MWSTPDKEKMGCWEPMCTIPKYNIEDNFATKKTIANKWDLPLLAVLFSFYPTLASALDNLDKLMSKTTTPKKKNSTLCDLTEEIHGNIFWAKHRNTTCCLSAVAIVNYFFKIQEAFDECDDLSPSILSTCESQCCKELL